MKWNRPLFSCIRFRRWALTRWVVSSLVSHHWFWWRWQSSCFCPISHREKFFLRKLVLVSCMYCTTSNMVCLYHLRLHYFYGHLPNSLKSTCHSCFGEIRNVSVACKELFSVDDNDGTASANEQEQVTPPSEAGEESDAVRVPALIDFSESSTIQAEIGKIDLGKRKRWLVQWISTLVESG